MRKLQLTRPLCFFDLETTGVDIFKSKIVSISIIKIFPDDTKEEFYHLVNPGIPIPKESSDIHRITDDQVKDQPYFETLADKIFSMFSGSDIAGFNSNNFDIPLLSIEFNGIGITFPEQGAKFVDVCSIFKKLNPRNLSAAFLIYAGRELTDAHNSHADNGATEFILNAMLNKHEDLPLTVAGLSKISDYDQEKIDLMGKFIRNEKGDPVYNFGKYKGQVVNFNNVEFIGWMLQPGKDFHPDTLSCARRIYDWVMSNSVEHFNDFDLNSDL